MGFVINFANVGTVKTEPKSEKREFDLLPDDDYLGRLEKATPGTTRKGDFNVNLQWRIEDGKYENRVLFSKLNFGSDAAQAWAKSVMVALGMEPDAEVDIVKQLEEFIEENAKACLTVVRKASQDIDNRTGRPYPDSNQIVAVKPAREYEGLEEFEPELELEEEDIPF